MTDFILQNVPASGTVTSFSAGNLSPLFTTSVATSTTTPALSFSLTNAAGGTVFGNNAASSGAPAYTIAPVLGIPGTSIGTLALASSTASGVFTLTAPASAATPTLTLPTTSNVLAGQFAGDGVILSSTLAVASAAGTVTAALANAAGGTLFGRATGSTGAPSYTTAPTLGIAGTSTGTIALASSTASGVYTITAPANAATPTLTLPTTSNVLAGQFAGDNTLFSNALVTASAAGTLTLPTPISQSANTVFAGPTTGASTTPAFRALVAADIASGTVLWNALGNAGGALTLANAGNATTFNQTSAVTWSWANTTTALAAGTVAPSPIISLGSRLFSSGVDTAATWTLQNSLNPTTALSFAITNASENSSNTVVLTIGTHTLVVGNWVTVSAITTAAFTYLNTLNGRITAIAATTITFQDSSLHGTQGSAACNGTVTQIPDAQLVITGSGSAGDQKIILPVPTNPVGTAMGTIQFSGQPLGTGFGSAGLSGGINQFVASGSGSTCFQFYAGGAGAVFTARGGITLGDNSNANLALTLTTSVSNNCSVALLSGYGTGTSNPSVMLGNANSFTATSGNQIGVGIGYGANSTVKLVFAPTSGSATFQSLINKYSINQTGGASGNVTGLLVNAVETAVGGTHLLLDLQAGTTGGTSKFAINNSGLTTKYAGVTTVSQGQPAEYATVDLTTQSGAIIATTLYAVPAGGQGMYRISWSADITTAAAGVGSSSILGGTNGFQIVATSPTDSVAKTFPKTVTAGVDTDATNTTATGMSGVIVVYAKLSTNIQYQMDYTSVGTTAMVYELHIKIEAM